MEERNHQRYPSQIGADDSHMARHGATGFSSPGLNGAMPIFNGQNPMPVPPPSGINGNGFSGHRQRQSTLGAPVPFDFSRSPPNNKNTAHVPCKFFRQGNCQAGSACPFSHQMDTINDPIPCKYFAKGNCKFGAKCANPHIMADGRDGRMMGQPWGGRYGSGQAAFNNRNRAPSLPFPDSAGPNGFASAAGPLSPALPHTQAGMEEYYEQPAQSRYLDLGSGRGASDLPSIAYPKFGSPSADLALSPPVRAMDAQLPSSFDTHNVSHIARFGPAAASVPSTFGLLKTPTSPALSTATPSAFSNLNYLTASNANNFSRSVQFGTSASNSGDDGFPRKILHSDLRSAPQPISMSVPGEQLFAHTGHDQDTDGSEEELNFVPGVLTDLLNPAERRRRFSRPEEDSYTLPMRVSLTSSNFVGSPSDSKVGSPSNASPSSRYGPLFQRQRAEHGNSDLLGTSSGSAFGHVGSPLRKSSLSNEMIAGAPPTFGGQNSLSPPSAGGLSMLSQQFRGLGVSSTEASQGISSSSTLAPSSKIVGGASASNGPRRPSGSTLTSSLSIANGPGARMTADRSISNGSMKSSAPERIDEEFLFSMDDQEEVKRKEEQRSQELASLENARSSRQQNRLSIGASPGGLSGRAWNMVAAKAVPSVALPMPASAGAQQRANLLEAAAARGLPKPRGAR